MARQREPRFGALHCERWSAWWNRVQSFLLEALQLDVAVGGVRRVDAVGAHRVLDGGRAAGQAAAAVARQRAAEDGADEADDVDDVDQAVAVDVRSSFSGRTIADNVSGVGASEDQCDEVDDVNDIDRTVVIHKSTDDAQPCP